ncbi:hypothetical protein CWE08_07690 [Aliidiomarina iranensis]|uniref:Uncharacterized protein n=1 Tax=Aliidiomarina iranensis TaxID=1434071 RepID=A0A432VWP1_9GAMM|nr:hypothetical protein CWE08_07690 [Aliidiomarina iranensis]
MARIILFFFCMLLLLISIPLSGHTGFYPTTWIQYKLGLDAASIHEECQHYVSSDSLLINCYMQKFKPLVNLSLWIYMLSYSVILYLAATGSNVLRKLLLMLSTGLTLYYVFSSGISSVGFVGNLVIALVFGAIIFRDL